MNFEQISAIDGRIEAATDQIVADTARLVRINSEQGKPETGAPFGAFRNNLRFFYPRSE